MPRQIDFEVSTDGHAFRPAVSIPVDVPEKDYGVIIKDFVCVFAGRGGAICAHPRANLREATLVASWQWR